MAAHDIIMAAAGGSTAATYIEDVFSTWLYTGNGSTQTITNGIDLSGKGGLVWLKSRSAATYNALFDTVRGANNVLWSNTTNAQVNYGSPGALTSFGATGFGLNAEPDVNDSGATYASWTFRKQPKFFDVVVKYHAGTSSTRADFRALGTIGCVIAKRTDGTGDWLVAHRSVSSGIGSNLRLNTTAAASSTDAWAFIDGTDGGLSTFAPAGEYVIYGFAHNAGGFGLTGTDNVISCGSFTVASGVADVNLGYEPQYLLWKQTNAAGNWYVFDTMRGWGYTQSADLKPNTSGAEVNNGGDSTFSFTPTATGFKSTNFAGDGTYIYIAIRRGPMKTPTTGTSVFSLQAYADASLGSSNPTLLGASTGFPVDLVMGAQRNQDYSKIYFSDRLRGASTGLNNTLASATTNAEGTYDSLQGFDTQQGAYTAYNNAWYYYSNLGRTFINYYLRRAPGFMDEVCYSGTGSATTVSHNLGVVPELMIIKNRAQAFGWYVYAQPLGATQYLQLQSTNASATSANVWNNTAPTSTQFTVGTSGSFSSGDGFVWYGFASCPGVSKVGSYTGTGATQTINCGFAARFVLIKRTDSTGSWWVWDTARGMVAGTDPRLAYNSTAVETNANWVYTNASGFQIVTTDATVNANGGSYIFLAIA